MFVDQEVVNQVTAILLLFLKSITFVVDPFR